MEAIYLLALVGPTRHLGDSQEAIDMEVDMSAAYPLQGLVGWPTGCNSLCVHGCLNQGLET